MEILRGIKCVLFVKKSIALFGMLQEKSQDRDVGKNKEVQKRTGGDL